METSHDCRDIDDLRTAASLLNRQPELWGPLEELEYWELRDLAESLRRELRMLKDLILERVEGSEECPTGKCRF